MTEQTGPAPPGEPPPTGQAPPPVPAPGTVPAAPEAAAATYPVRVDVDYQPEYARFGPLYKWLLAIPHYIALLFVGIGAYFAIVIAWFAVLFTGRWPEGLFNFVVGTLRWGQRVNSYVYLQTDKYPPFSLQPDPGDTVRLEVDYPQQIARWRPLVSWLMVFPYWFCAFFISAIASICYFIAWFAILFTKRYPQQLFDVVTISFRWNARALGYGYFMTEKYPPFVWA